MFDNKRSMNLLLFIVILLLIALTLNNLSFAGPDDKASEIGRYQLHISDSPAVFEVPGPYAKTVKEVTGRTTLAIIDTKTGEVSVFSRLTNDNYFTKGKSIEF